MTEQKAGSILAAMSAGVRGIAQDKAAAGQGLTPVASEKRTVLPGAAFPNDMPTEVMAEVARDIERSIGHLQAALAALREREARVVTEVVPPKVDKANERFAGADPEPEVPAGYVTAEGVENGETDEPEPVSAEAFAAEFEAKAAAMQADAFQSEAAPAGWQCPVHGEAGVAKTSPGGRDYIGCPTDGCKKFQKEN
jgi:hypothetical protein